jgi:hypothetical protein
METEGSLPHSQECRGIDRQSQKNFLFFSEIWYVLQRGAANWAIFTKNGYVRNAWEVQLSK